MTNEQLVALIQDGQNADDHMLELWQQNQGLIAKTALKYSGYEDIEDLKQQGYIGLCNAVNAYRPDKGVSFSSYAVFWLKQSMYRYIEECGSVVRIPASTKGLMIKYKRFTAAVQSAYGRRPSDLETMLYLGISRECMNRLQSGIVMEHIKSLDIPVCDDDNCTFYELIQGDTDVESEVLENMQAEYLAAILWDLVAALPGQEPEIIAERYQNGRTRKEIGRLTKNSTQKVCDLEKDALRRLRHGKKSGLLKSFLPKYNSELASKAMKGTGVKRFQNTWTSATERVALNELY
ncbi:MAG: sigma-70 family RNA polymerase sigma factor [Lachnospiraceae bacterium]|nr:sigma-70 family RNA polymerase sigma factor [Lachnospiraceae bacterium]